MTRIYTYTPTKPPLAESTDELRARIPGWGVDLDPQDRPSVPKLQLDPSLRGEDTDLPERQPERSPRERSIEHAFLTPVFGTSCPPKGLSGRIRRVSYARYSEARAAHWLLLLFADRVDALGSTLGSFLTRHPDNLLTETGVLSELTHHGLRSRWGQKRADTVHHPLDPLIVAGPWILPAAVAYTFVRKAALRRGAHADLQGRT
jgi:hypothetical protein